MKKLIVETNNNNLTKEELQELIPNYAVYEYNDYSLMIMASKEYEMAYNYLLEQSWDLFNAKEKEEVNEELNNIFKHNSEERYDLKK